MPDPTLPPESVPRSAHQHNEIFASNDMACRRESLLVYLFKIFKGPLSRERLGSTEPAVAGHPSNIGISAEYIRNRGKDTVCYQFPRCEVTTAVPPRLWPKRNEVRSA